MDSLKTVYQMAIVLPKRVSLTTVSLNLNSVSTQWISEEGIVRVSTQWISEEDIVRVSTKWISEEDIVRVSTKWISEEGICTALQRIQLSLTAIVRHSQ